MITIILFISSVLYLGITGFWIMNRIDRFASSLNNDPKDSENSL